MPSPKRIIHPAMREFSIREGYGKPLYLGDIVECLSKRRPSAKGEKLSKWDGWVTIRGVIREKYTVYYIDFENEYNKSIVAPKRNEKMKRTIRPEVNWLYYWISANDRKFGGSVGDMRRQQWLKDMERDGAELLWEFDIKKIGTIDKEKDLALLFPTE